ncbi:hypothetical protein FH972_002545 [Carpinus fangiana]|uniref:Uncharacterized protein n=1 Tax=Carpinus fangiana TaxID=176857 RepID=A0A5N6QH27_9ROSI|nr:hypothetical protein FH972_002545 [Carpinus fangiana]
MRVAEIMNLIGFNDSVNVLLLHDPTQLIIDSQGSLQRMSNEHRRIILSPLFDLSSAQWEPVAPSSLCWFQSHLKPSVLESSDLSMSEVWSSSPPISVPQPR